jgi:hypothetical protein
VTVLRLERIAAGSVDDAIASLGAVTLARSPDGAFAEVDDARVERCTRALAFAGVRATATTVQLAPPAGTRVAIGRDLGPLAPRVLALDLVHVRALPLGPETRRLLRTWPWRRLEPGQRARCRDLLRGEDAILGWRRRAWASAGVLRTAEVRRVVRPVVFDHAAIGAPPERRSFARDRAIGDWLFG